LHLLCFAAFFTEFRWYYPVVALISYYVRMFGVTGVHHRYFSHRTYKTSRWFQFVLAFLAETSTQKGVLWWGAHHRDHHKHSDDPEDVHSPVQKGFWWSHVGWIMVRRYTPTNLHRIADFAKYPELVWLNKYYLVPPIALGVAMFLIGGWPLLLWGYFISTVVLWHGTFTINSLAHLWGSKRYVNTDDSRNNFWLAMITLGEGWHNNHHYYQSSTNQGFFWWEIDITYYILKAMSAVGLVWDLRTPPKHVRDAYLEQQQAIGVERMKTAAAKLALTGTTSPSLPPSHPIPN
jgi:stearoyl-CoA desaturase (delta-9 desaturase)